ncbi:MAG: SusC/RagA family TonB-linked outer membrane protein [Muribaculaceae bacterium]|nr:SusC/RagA family TonB-linked outer membrane protein [Muribaculaceae bacterium]
MCVAIAFWVAAGFTAFADVKGTIQDKEGEPIVGATVLVKGTQKGAAADLDGNFVLTGVDANATLLVSAVGYTPQEIALKGRTSITVTLLEDSKVLDDVVVIGYGSLQKKQVTSSITSIKGDDLVAGVGGSTIATALQGKIAGLTIDGNNSPNAGNSFQLRGVSSVRSGKSPLIVIDGIPGGDFRALNQEDIESIDVLKDASAGAIYGTRAASGVILITTKQAKQGNVRVSYTGEFSTEFMRKKPEMLNASEYLEYVPNTADFGYDTDWYDAVTVDHPFSQQHTIALQGGTDNLSVYSSLMYKDQEGIVIGDGRKDYSGRINATYKLFDNRVEIGVRLQAREADRDQRGGTGTVRQATIMNPTIPLMDPDSPTELNVNKYGAGSDWSNPVADVMYRYDNAKDQWLLGTFTLKARLYDGLSLNASANIDRRQWQRVQYQDAKHLSSLTNGRTGWARHDFSKTNNISYDAYLSYLKEFGADKEHRLDATAGWSFWESNGESFWADNANFSVNGVGPWNLGEGTYLKDGLAGMSSGKNIRNRLLSFFGRANYSYDDKYMVSASVRREASSKFGRNNRWGTFWAVSGGWRISREEFMDNTRDWLSDLKLRVAYGVTGNNDFSSGNTVIRLTSYGGYPVPGTGVWAPCYGPANNANPDLKWEEKKELNVGLDFSLLNDRLWGKFDWYTRDVDNLLFSVDAPQPPYVENSIMRNIGTMKSTGWEIELGGIAVQTRDFSWTPSINLSHNSSKITKLGMKGQTYTDSDEVGFPSPGSPGDGARLYDGAPIGQFWVYKYAGLDENGNFMIYDDKGEAIPAAGNLKQAYKQYVGNAIPKLFVTWNNTLRYRDFDFGLQLRGQFDFDVYSQPSMYNGLIASSGQNLIKNLYELNKDVKGDKLLCDYFIYDATFVKIDAINVGYTLNTSKWTNYLQKARIYLTLRDVATFTKYKGLNPEVNVNGLWPGFEKQNGTSTYPQTIRATMGVQLTF